MAGWLPVPGDEQWIPVQERLGRMLARARAVREVSPLDGRDLRGWHFALGGSVLLRLSQYGFGHGMTGRYAFVSDDYAECRWAIDRLRLVLDAGELRERLGDLVVGERMARPLSRRRSGWSGRR